MADITRDIPTREDEQPLPRCSEEVRGECLERYAFPATLEYLETLSATQTLPGGDEHSDRAKVNYRDRLDWRFFTGAILLGIGVYWYRKKGR